MNRNKMVSLYFLLFCFILMTTGCEYFTNYRRTRYVEKHSELSSTQRDLILKGKLWTGMTKEEVRACLGNPTLVSEDILDKKEVWTYIYKDQYISRRKYMFERALRLEFREGRLVNWRED